MIVAVIPACNEEERITSVLDNLGKVHEIDLIIPVLNGCVDHTREKIMQHALASCCAFIDYPFPFGIDVPRKWGAHCAKQFLADVILFVDGDLEGEYAANLAELIASVCKKGTDLALTNCYPYIAYRSETAKAVLYYREQLNRKLGLFSSIGLATPSHGPHCISSTLLKTVGTDCLSIPPLMLAKAAEAGLKIQVATSLTDQQWSSCQRGDVHNQKIAETIIGDCIAARQYICHQPITREENGICYLGYRSLDMNKNTAL